MRHIKSQISAADRKMARRVADRLLGIRKFRVLRETESLSGWKQVKTFPSLEQATRYTDEHTDYFHCIEEVDV